ELESLSPKSLDNTPLSFDSLTGAGNDIDKTGKIKLIVADPIGDLTEDDYSIVVPVESGQFAHKDKIAPTVESIRKVLAPVKGQLWQSGLIKSYLSSYFEDSDYPRIPDSLAVGAQGIFVTQTELPKVIEIGKISRIARIDLMKFEDHLSALDLVVRQLFD